MSLIGALNIGRTALAVNQAAIQVTGNNISNAGNPNYTRQVATIGTAGDQRIAQGVSVGMGISLTSIERQINEALEGRLRSSVSDDNAAATTKQWLDRVESVFNELGDQDLSTRLSTFFNSWSKLADNPLDPSQRTIVLQNGQSLASWIQQVRGDLAQVQSDLGTSIKSVVADADGLAQQVATLNKQIASAEGSGAGTANALRDQRDAVLKQLSELVDIHTSDGNNGMVNVFLGSEPLVMNDTCRGLTTKTLVTNGQMTVGLAFKTGGATAEVTGGQLGAMVSLQTGQLKSTIDQLDSLAGNLIFELNKAFSGGQGTQGYSTVTSTNGVTDPAAALDAAGLPFTPASGSFLVSVYNSSGQVVSSGLVSVKLGADAGASPTTLNDLAAAFGGISGISASVSGGKLTLSTGSSDLQIKFGTDEKGDTSGTLAALGINTFFTGSTASDIAVNSTVTSNAALLATSSNGTAGGNAVAQKIAGLQSQSIAGLGGRTLTATYDDMINQTAVSAATAQSNADAASVVRQTLESQRESLSGVSMDEEAVNLIKQQRAFQGAARLVSAIDEMMQTILNMAG